MPMKLGFLRNATQRIASHKWIPSQHLEAVILYGHPSKRAQAVKKVVEEAPNLIRHKQTHQLLVTVIDATDKTVRCELLYALRGKIVDLCRDRFANVVLQHLYDKLPPRQRVEIAQDLKTDAADLARHPIGGHVIQKIASCGGEAAEVLVEGLGPELDSLALHAVGQHSVAALIGSGLSSVIQRFAEPTALKELIAMQESAALTALAKALLSDDIQRAVHSQLFADLATLCAESRQHFALCAAVEAMPLADAREWAKKLTPKANELSVTKGSSEVIATLILKLGQDSKPLATKALSAFATPVDAAVHPYGSLVLRAAIAAGNVAVSATYLNDLATNAVKLAESPAGVVVIARMFSGEPTVATALAKPLMERVNDLACHTSGAHALQALLDHADQPLREEVAGIILNRLADFACDAHGTYVVQKAFGSAAPAVVDQACEALAPTAIQVAQDPKGCFTVAAALMAAKRHQLPSAKTLMDSLKPHVTILAVKPWVGRVVLDAMFNVGSAQLKAKIQEVIFLKCEYFLSGADIPVHTGGGGRRERSSDSRGRGDKRNRAEAQA